MADEAPDHEPDQHDGEPPSFFALLLAETHDPYDLPETVVEYQDDAGPYSLRHRITLPVPDDAQVASLDAADSVLDEIEVLAGDDVDDVLDVLEARDWPPAAFADEILAHFHLDVAPESGWGDVVERLNVYGRGLEYDLWERGHDLRDTFRAGDWDRLLRVASRLPSGSHYRSAMQADDELAAQIAEVHGPPSKRKRKSGRPPLEGFTLEVSYLHRLSNQLRRLEWAVFRSQAGKRGSSPPRPEKGPETADDRFEFADFMREHDEVVAQVLVDDGRPPTPPQRLPPPEAVRGAVLLEPPTTPPPALPPPMEPPTP